MPGSTAAAAACALAVAQRKTAGANSTRSPVGSGDDHSALPGRRRGGNRTQLNMTASPNTL